MEWIIGWWEGMTGLQQAFACVAVPATLLLILQTVLLLFGMGGGDGEFDQPGLPGEGAPDAPGFPAFSDGAELPSEADMTLDAGLGVQADADVPDAADVPEHPDVGDAAGVRLLTVRGFVAFFAVGGWLGIALIDAGLHPALAAVLAVCGGFVALAAVAYLLKWSLKLQENGTLDLRGAIARTGTVYIPIPADRAGTGKVTLTVQSQFLELDAMTDSPEPLPTGAAVQVVGVFAGNTLLVRKL